MKLTSTQTKLVSALSNGFVDQRFDGAEELVPRFIYNNKGDSMLMHIERELDCCSSFTFVIAFVTESALAALKVKLADLAAKGIQGRILTSNYLAFNKPKAFQELLKLSKVEVKISNNKAFHAKGYVFDHEMGNYQSVIIGSSNMTSGALLKNYEWNIKFTSHDNGALTEKLISEVEEEWTKAEPLTRHWIEQYRKLYDSVPRQRMDEELEDVSPKYAINKHVIEPNKMQNEALSSLADIRKAGAHRSLIISATGTGKTYLGALDVSQYQPQRFLYIVHREQILNKTMESFKNVLRSDFYNQFQDKYGDQTETKFDEQFGVISGDSKNFKAKYLFATIQTLAKDERLSLLEPTQFDYILIDEVHRAGASSYQKVIKYFQPDFLLGMTATPDRMDGFNLYEMFDYNIAYEIRLQKALDEKMLCPFRYIGITDYQYDGQITDDTSKLKWLVSEERVDYVIKQTKYYGYSGDVLHGLIFCSLSAEAEELADALTRRGYTSKKITGNTPQSERREIVKELENGDINYIVTVDVFNEGVDIPCVNQIVMLRSTQSSIVFIQQLGRGLRKFAGKDYVTVIDFIGNYKNNYLIPIALTGDRSRNKNSARDDLESRQISGLSTVSFSEIAKEKIYQSINNTSLDSLKVLRDDYQNLKNRLGRVPLLVDFQKFGTVDCTVFANRYKNYYQFLVKMKEDVHLTANQEAILSFISIELMNGKRIVELLLLRELIESKGFVKKSDFRKLMRDQSIFYNENVEHSVERVLTLSFFVKASQEKYGDKPLIMIYEGGYQLNEAIQKYLVSQKLFQQLVEDALFAGIMRANRYNVNQQFTLYERYTRKDVCRLLGWEKDVSSTVYGYRIRQNTCPIFVTYAKSGKIDQSINYQDRFINADTFQWFTRHNVKIGSKEVQAILAPQTTIQLFIKKNDDEGSDFYYFGEVKVDKNSLKEESFRVNDTTEPIVKMALHLKRSAQYDKYLLFEK
ncbi:DUF3427 domain-containing protein [Lactiplantibacillus xiangfangensis]|uniref:DNA RNA helicase n=1 Tax=Lactiplantibacillus xiangfangensis TaxID=942150 RepID=A0A0R2MW41_9LACO|nr:DEAD/DEAH box helicase [Lactiplantibacillus xiangfangensis]KRO14954.1 DNA RNA helicase [Lactiplantibacillus xiangfangensis]